MTTIGRPRRYATNAARQHAYRARKLRAAVAPHVPCRQLGPHCTVYCGDWQTVSALLPSQAAVVTDPPYRVGTVGFDYTKARRRPSHWDQNYVGVDQPFDPTPLLGFPEVVLFGANHYWDRLPAGGQAAAGHVSDQMACGDRMRFFRACCTTYTAVPAYPVGCI